MPVIELSRYYPATPEETYEALIDVVRALAKFRGCDDFSLAVTFSTKMTGWASGANMSAQAMPQRGGTMLRVEGQSKMRSQVNANNAAHKQLERIFEAVGHVILENRELPVEAEPAG